MTVRQLHHRMTWLSAQSAKPHIIGWRVTANTPVGARVMGLGALGLGKAGLPRKLPRNNSNAGRVRTVATIHPTSPEPGRSTGGAARKARTIQPKVANATSE